jgi:DNA-binding NarL/FixJ family response regulator
MMRSKRGPSGFAALTPRELEVALLLAAGHTVNGIAARLRISGKTVATHQVAVRYHLKVKTGAALTLLAIREGFISMHDEAP